MPSICLYLHLHQARRLRWLSVFAPTLDFFDRRGDRERLERDARAVVLPGLRRLLEALRRHDGRVRLRIWLSGLFLEQAEECGLPLMDSLHQLNDTGLVDWLADSYYHSLAFLYDPEEFALQVERHGRRIRGSFRRPALEFPVDGRRWTPRMPGGAAECRILSPPPDKATHVLLGRAGPWADGELESIIDDALKGRGPAPRTSARKSRGLKPVSGGRGRGADPEICAPADAVGWVAFQPRYARGIGRPLASDALHAVFALRAAVTKKGDPALLHAWRCLQSTDFYDALSVTEEPGAAGPDSPYEEYVQFMTALDHLAARLCVGCGTAS